VNVVDAAELPEAIVQVTVCPLTEHPEDTPLMVKAESIVSETVAAPAVAEPVLPTVKVMNPGPVWKRGQECAAKTERDAGATDPEVSIFTSMQSAFAPVPHV
jgi:hypothetical protein